MEFIQLVLLEGILLLCAGMIIFGGIWGTIAATVALSGINYLFHDATMFWQWETPMLAGGTVGMLLILIVGKTANKSKLVGGLVGGLSSLVLFGAFATPVIAIILWALVFGTGIIPKGSKNQMLWSFAPAFLRIILGLGWIIYGNLITI